MSPSTALLPDQLLLAVPAAAHIPVQPTAASVYTMSAGRLGASAAALLGLAGVVIGVMALTRPAGRFGTGSGRLGTVLALSTGLVAMAIGALVAATADGGLGSGNGLGGAFVALIVGLIATVLGVAGLTRRAQPSTPVAESEAPTGLDSGDPRWRR